MITSFAGSSVVLTLMYDLAVVAAGMTPIMGKRKSGNRAVTAMGTDSLIQKTAMRMRT